MLCGPRRQQSLKVPYEVGMEDGERKMRAGNGNRGDSEKSKRRREGASESTER